MSQVKAKVVVRTRGTSPQLHAHIGGRTKKKTAQPVALWMEHTSYWA